MVDYCVEYRHVCWDFVVGRIGISRRASIIGEVFEDTPARKAGLKKNDTEMLRPKTMQPIEGKK